MLVAINGWSLLLSVCSERRGVSRLTVLLFPAEECDLFIVTSLFILLLDDHGSNPQTLFHLPNILAAFGVAMQ